MVAAEDVPGRWKRPPVLIKNTLVRRLVYSGFLVYLAFAVSTIEVNWLRVYGGLERGWRFVQGFLVPDFVSRWGDILQGMTERFDTVISRAFSNLQTFLLLAFPFLKKGGILLAMKGELEKEEIRLFSEGEETRYRLQKTASFVLPKSSFKRSILLFEKG